MAETMPTRSSPIHEAARLTSWQLAELGREIRIARISGGRTQAQVARAVGTSAPRISLVEHGRVGTITVRQLARIGAVVGLRVSIRAFPAGRRVLDQAQIDLLAELRARAHRAWRWQTEVPMPIPGDYRATDARATIDGCSLAVELWTRLADAQAQTRAALVKARDLGADRLIIVLAGTRANREAVRQTEPMLTASFPLRSRDVLRALATGRDPGGNGIVFL